MSSLAGEDSICLSHHSAAWSLDYYLDEMPVCYHSRKHPESVTTDGNPFGNVKNSSGLSSQQTRTTSAKHISQVCCQSKRGNIKGNWMWTKLKQLEIKQPPPET